MKQVGFQVINTEDQWVVPAVNLVPSCYLGYGFTSLAFIHMQGGPWSYMFKVFGMRLLVSPRQAGGPQSLSLVQAGTL